MEIKDRPDRLPVQTEYVRAFEAYAIAAKAVAQAMTIHLPLVEGEDVTEDTIEEYYRLQNETAEQLGETAAFDALIAARNRLLEFTKALCQTDPEYLPALVLFEPQNITTYRDKILEMAVSIDATTITPMMWNTPALAPFKPGTK